MTFTYCPGKNDRDAFCSSTTEKPMVEGDNLRSDPSLVLKDATLTLQIVEEAGILTTQFDFAFIWQVST